VDKPDRPINSITNFRDMTPFVLAIHPAPVLLGRRQYSFARGGIR